MFDLPEFAESSQSKDRVKVPRLPSEQGQNIPKGWKPTMAQPIPSVRCTGTIRQGERKGEQCDKWSMSGATVCFQHGGSLPNVKKAAEARKEAARLKLLDVAEDAAGMLEFLMNYSTQDQIKLKAAMEILDRVGVKGGIDLNVTHSVDISPATILAEKLAGMQKSIEADKNKEFTSSTDPDIIDVEVVPAEDPEKPEEPEDS